MILNMGKPGQYKKTRNPAAEELCDRCSLEFQQTELPVFIKIMEITGYYVHLPYSTYKMLLQLMHSYELNIHMHTLVSLLK